MQKTIDEIIHSPRRPVVIAHRGASFYHRENTMEAFEAAVDMNAEMVELDVHRTKDGVLVVHHDPGFPGGEIGSMTMAQVEEASDSAGYLIPALVEVLQFCRDKVPVDIELKEPGYEEQVLETVMEILEPDQFLISSSYDVVVLKIKALRPEVKTGLVLYRASFPGLLRHLFPASRVRLCGADIIMVSDKLLRFEFFRFNRELGKPVWVYTINDRKRMWDLISSGMVGAIFTDRPDVGLFLRDLHVVSQNPD
jgi:glycerophosphoryl diester phosphodiesterase